MARAKTKDELLAAGASQFEKLVAQIEGLSEKELAAPFDFTGDVKKKEAHWQRDRNLRDSLSHLYEWHQLLINWIVSNQKGERQPFLPAPYNWRSYGELNQLFWAKHQETSLAAAQELLLNSHKTVMTLIEGFSNEALFTPKYFSWTGTTTLGSYCISATSSHYDWALKKINAHKKQCQVSG